MFSLCRDKCSFDACHPFVPVGTALSPTGLTAGFTVGVSHKTGMSVTEKASFFWHILPAEIGITKLYNQKQTAHYASRIAKFEITWVIVGGESGPSARPVMQEWVTDIRDQCLRV